MSEVISRSALLRLVDEWIAKGTLVAGPRGDCPNSRSTKTGLSPSAPLLYARLESSAQLLLDGFIHPRNTIKEFVFPRHEKLYGYSVRGKNVELVPLDPPSTEQILVGVRPCDAASLPILDHVFNWDYKDPFYNRHRELTTVITLACREHDANCFCTSVASGPGDQRGSDVMLLDLGDGNFEVRCLTEKGKRLFASQTQTSDTQGPIGPGPKKQFDLEAVHDFLDDGYESPAWSSLTQRCMGCGACAFTCPTCHCFDMIDEGNVSGGVRVRNWDACQFSMFTLHASGHNPRSVQAQRQRQRVFHKFRIYPEKFGDLLCTGCGNCTRNCPVGLGIRPVVEALGAKKTR
jgi:ferredoxin